MLANWFDRVALDLRQCKSSTCGLAGNLEAFLYCLEGNDEVNVPHGLESPENPINRDESLCVGKPLKEPRVTTPGQPALCACR